MTETQKIISEIKAKTGLKSDYAVASALDVTRATLSNYKAGRSMDDDTALKAAELTGADPFTYIARVNAERTKSPQMRQKWERLIQGAAVIVALIFSGFPTAAPAAPATVPTVADVKDYTH